MFRGKDFPIVNKVPESKVYQQLKLESMISAQLHTWICDMYILGIEAIWNTLQHYSQQSLQSCCPFESVSRVTYIFKLNC